MPGVFCLQGGTRAPAFPHAPPSSPSCPSRRPVTVTCRMHAQYVVSHASAEQAQARALPNTTFSAFERNQVGIAGLLFLFF